MDPNSGRSSDALTAGFSWAFGTLGVLFGILVLWTLVYCYAIYKQEIRAFRKTTFARICLLVFIWVFGSLLAVIKCLPLIICRGCFHPRVGEKAFHYASKLGKTIARWVIAPPIVLGKENLPEDSSKPVIFVANHQSMLDICLLYYIDRRFRWVSKSAVFTIPGVGLLMILNQDVPLKRGKKESILKMFAGCRESVQDDGVSLMIFPQGTRQRFEILPFKDGAFELACDLNVPVVPITISIPADIWTNPKNPVSLTIHPMINPASGLVQVREEAYKAIMSCLPYYSEELEEQGRASYLKAKQKRWSPQSSATLPSTSPAKDLDEPDENSLLLV
mmetsp:Transcript_32369/g.41478  ORF Transcript_32369/g.41478 Transcript_32369/m.41478 type:complete len:333 (+) Transcript_32369:100-1098(+)